jgi:hypothetical protein
MDFADLMALAGVEQDALGRRRLAGINVGHDAEVAIVDRWDENGAWECSVFRVVTDELPAVVREGAVGFRHPVRVFALLDGVATVVGGVHQLGREALDHGAVVAATGSGDQPADRESLAALGANLDGDLVGRAADAAGADLDRGATFSSAVLKTASGSLFACPR